MASFKGVTASDVIITAILKSFSDIYWAIRGGGSKSGIVTKIKLEAFSLEEMCGGQRIYPEDTFSAVLDAVYSFATTKPSQDIDAAEITVGSSDLFSRLRADYDRRSPTLLPSVK